MPANPTPTTTAASEDASQSDLIRFDHISKQFGNIIAVEDISLSVKRGEILALVGDNGAGKSTLMNILAGVYPQTSGELYYDGEPVSFSNPGAARSFGIETIYQDLALMDDLDIATNIHLQQFPKRFSLGPIEMIDWQEANEATREVLEFLNLDLDPGLEVEWLSGGERQLVAIARSILSDPDMIILDEPTSALSVAGTDLVKETMLQLKEDGHTQIIVTHNFEEVLNVADRIAVLYQGELVEIVDPQTVDRESLSNLITTGQRTP